MVPLGAIAVCTFLVSTMHATLVLGPWVVGRAVSGEVAPLLTNARQISHPEKAT